MATHIGVTHKLSKKVRIIPKKDKSLLVVTIYILKLEQNKYYIGKTNNPKLRLKQHINNNGSSWTKKYKPVSILKIHNNCDPFDEDKYTKML